MLRAKERHWEKQAKARDKNNPQKRCFACSKKDARMTASPDSFGRLGLPPVEVPKLSGKAPLLNKGARDPLFPGQEQGAGPVDLQHTY